MKTLAAIGAFAITVTAAAYLVDTAPSPSSDDRTGAVLRGHAAEMHAALMTLEDRIPAGTLDDTQWKVFIAEVDRAVAAGDRSAAAYRWRDAYAIALGTRGWEPLLEAGDAALRVGALSLERGADRHNARDAYMAALLRARRARSVEGIQHVAEAFARLGDPETATLVRAMSDRYASTTAREQP
jgi:hypothetical protein